MTEAGSHPGAARRAVLRWSWRLFRREWRQQLLTLILLTVAVAGAVWASSVAVNAGSKAEGALGDARAMIRVDAKDPSAAQADVSAIERRFGPAEVITHASTTAPGVAGALDVRAQDPNGRYGHPMLGLRSGRYPSTDAEIALTGGAAEQFNARVGDHITVDGVSRTVVGMVENPRNLDDEFALVSPSTALAGSTLNVLVGTDHPIHTGSADDSNLHSFNITGRSDDSSAIVTLVIAAVTVSMALVGLIAASGFVVVAQRRQRQLGLLAALGATERELRLVLVAAGALVGIAAATVGTVVGLAAWLVTAPIAERAAAHRIDRFDLPWPLLALCILLAIAAAVGAAWWPARRVSRVPVMAAISQRPTRPLPVHRSAALAALLLIAGVIGIALAKPRNTEVKPWLLLVGLLGVIAGTVLVAPAAIRAAAAPARRLRLGPRLALRDLVRHQARAGAALAAITLALAIAVATTVVARATAQEDGLGNLSDHQLVVSLAGRQGPFATIAASNDVARLDQAVASMAAAIQAPTVLQLDVAVPAATGEAPPEPVSVATPVDHGFNGGGLAYVATPDLLARFGIDPSTIDGTTDLLTDQPHVVLFDVSTRPERGMTTPTQRVALSPYSSAPTALITEAAMRRHSWTEQRGAWLVESPAAFSADQLATARRAAADAGLVVESRDANDGGAALGRVATLGGSLLALAILAMTIGLLRGEWAADVRTLTAVGAPSRTRRAVTATAAAVLALTGVVLASGGAYIALLAVYRTDLSKLSSPPVANLLVLALGLPALAAAVGWTFAGREPAHLARQLE